jgi:TRAP-type C4-dicarboxylate transport system permease small subunit
MSNDWTLYVLLFVFAAIILQRLERLGKQIEAVHDSILLEITDEQGRAELLRERQWTKKQAAKEARQFWIFWSVVAAAALVWFAVKHSR